MKVIKYLKDYGISRLKNELNIKVKTYEEEKLYVLNYNQIGSPKTNPIVIECRGLIIDFDFNVVSRSFDRFFNLGEAPEQTDGFELSRAICYEKVDGSLIKLYSHNGKWQFSTRGTAFAEAENYTGKTFLSLILDAIGFNSMDELSNKIIAEGKLLNDRTYIFEFISPENRIVTPYEKLELVFLGVVNKLRISEIACEYDGELLDGLFPYRLPTSHSFTDNNLLKNFVSNLQNLKEGLVCYDPLSRIRVKVKNELYVKVHKIRGDLTLTPSKIWSLVVTNEYDEYLTYYPEDKDKFIPYVNLLHSLMADMMHVWESVVNIEDQKEFALTIAKVPYKWALFSARKRNTNPCVAFEGSSIIMKVRTMEGYSQKEVR